MIIHTASTINSSIHDNKLIKSYIRRVFLNSPIELDMGKTIISLVTSMKRNLNQQPKPTSNQAINNISLEGLCKVIYRALRAGCK